MTNAINSAARDIVRGIQNDRILGNAVSDKQIENRVFDYCDDSPEITPEMTARILAICLMLEGSIKE